MEDSNINQLDYQIIYKKDFPEKLKNIKNSPEMLYAIGDISLLYEDSFGIVGTRKPTEYGIKACKEFSREFALREIPIISGMALGIDTIAHQTVLEQNSKTIGVIGCGFEHYLKNSENVELFNEIIQKGNLIISEYNLTVESNKNNFPQRNRIIAALSEGILVVEAAFRSGSSITARFATEYGKSVFAVPGNIYEKMCVGTNNLIKKGAVLISEPEEIIVNYPQFVNKKRKTFKKSTKKEKIYKKEWEEIINILKDEAHSIEELQLKINKDIKTLMKLLSEMEIEGIIEQEIGIGYILKVTE